MTVMLVGLIPADAPVPDDAPDHLRITTAGLTAVALALPDDLDWTDEDTTLRLARVRHDLLCRHAGQGDVAPIDLGAVFSTIPVLRDYIDRHACDLGDRLARLAGRAEYALAVDVAPDRPVPTAARSGRDHLRQRAALRDRRDLGQAARRGFLSLISERIAPMAEHRRIVPGRQTGRLGRVDFVTRRDGLDHCRQALDALLPQARDLGLTLTLTGPYPAFSVCADRSDV